mgnify:FL=1
MEKNISLSAKQSIAMSISTMVKNFMGVVNKPIGMLADYYSKCLERNINTKQTWLLVNAQVAFFFAAFPVSCPLMLRLVCIAWMLHALKLCKDNL